MNRLAVVIDDYALAALPRLDLQLAHAGAMVMRSFRGLPNPQLLRRLPDYDGAAVVSGNDRFGLVARLETATSTLNAPVIAVLPRGVEQSSDLRGPGVVDLIPAGTERAAERVVLMARVPIVSSGRGSIPRRDTPRPQSAPEIPPGPLELTRRPRPESEAHRGPPERFFAIASSTGGVWVLAELLRSLGGGQPEAVLLAQHMESEFVAFFADWLTSVSGWTTVLVDQPVPIESGRVYLAVGGRDLCVEGGRALAETPKSRYVPCADRLLRSLALAFGSQSAAAVLSGMGSDGAEGLAEIARYGGRAVCQLPGSAVVPSMPESALARAKGALAVPPAQIGAALRGE